MPVSLSNLSYNVNYQDSNEPEKIERTLLGFIIVIQTFMIGLGFLGNVLVIHLVLFNIKLRNVRNAFMLNLTFSNLLLVSICTPSFLITLIFPNWAPGNFWCKFLHSIQIVITLVVSFSIMMIAIDRWMFVVYARSRQLNSRDALLIIIGIWLVAILLAAPTFFQRRTKSLYDDLSEVLYHITPDKLQYLNSTNMSSRISNLTGGGNAANFHQPFSGDFNLGSLAGENFSLDKTTYYCVEHWKYPLLKRIYILILFCLEFVLPCVAMLTTYMWIIKFLKVQDDKMSHYEQLRKKLIQKERPHQKNCKLLSALCITFIVCCLPLSLFNIKAEFDFGKVLDASFKEKEIYSPLTILTTLEVLNTVVSPLLYGFMNHNFRIEINEKIKSLKIKYKKVNTSDLHRDDPSILKKANIEIELQNKNLK